MVFIYVRERDRELVKMSVVDIKVANRHEGLNGVRIVFYSEECCISPQIVTGANLNIFLNGGNAVEVLLRVASRS